MTPCRLYLTACALSFAFGCMLGLMIANRMLMALEDERSASRERLGRHKDSLDFEAPPAFYRRAPILHTSRVPRGEMEAH